MRVTSFSLLTSGENVIQIGYIPVRTCPSSLRSGREYAKTASARVLLTQSVLLSGVTPMPCEKTPLGGDCPPPSSGSLIVDVTFRSAKSTTSNPCKKEVFTNIRRVEPSEFLSNAMVRTILSNLIDQTAFSV